MHIGIIGGGIGGLTAAIACHRRGHRVTLLERAPRFAPVGAGIVLAPNAARLLGHLGVDLARDGRRLPAMAVCSADGRVLQRVGAAENEAIYGPTWALTRPELHAALEAALPADVEVGLGVQVTDIQQDALGVTAAGRRFDLLVGADGLRSAVREAVIGPWPTRYSGQTCWRGVTSNPGFDGAVEALGPGVRVGVVPLSRDRLYYFLVARAPVNAPNLPWPEGFARFGAAGGFAGLVGAVVDRLTEAPPLHHDLVELDAPVWGAGRAVLIGDAAHAMTPNQGQGAAMAVEDALVLSRLLDAPDVPAALRAARHARVRRVQLDSRRIGQVAHWESGLARAVRDAALSWVPAWVGARQYRAIVEPGFALLDG